GTLTYRYVEYPPHNFPALHSSPTRRSSDLSYTIDGSGHWSYTLDNSNSAVEALNVGGQLTDTFTVTTVDGTAQVVTITIDGTNDTAGIYVTTTVTLLDRVRVANGIAGTPTA